MSNSTQSREPPRKSCFSLLLTAGAMNLTEVSPSGKSTAGQGAVFLKERVCCIFWSSVPGGEQVEVQENIYVKTQVQLGVLLLYFSFTREGPSNKQERGNENTVLIPTFGVSRLPFPLQYVQGDTACICTGSSHSPFPKKTTHCVITTFISMSRSCFGNQWLFDQKWDL